MFAQQFVSQYLAGLATPCHRIDIKLGEGLLRAARGFIAVREHRLLIFEDCPEEFILNIFAPKRLSIILLQMSDLIPTVDGRVRRRSCRTVYAFLPPRACWCFGTSSLGDWCPGLFILRHIILPGC